MTDLIDSYDAFKLEDISDVIGFLKDIIVECDPSEGCQRCNTVRRCIEVLEKSQSIVSNVNSITFEDLKKQFPRIELTVNESVEDTIRIMFQNHLALGKITGANWLLNKLKSNDNDL